MIAAPKVSVVMPIYNAGKYLAEAVDSLLCQTLQDFEIVAVDDCSSDNSTAILEGYADPRIRIFRNEKNLGAGKTANRGLEFCRGEFIARMDADDVSLPVRLDRQCRFLQENPTISGVGTEIQRMDGEGNPLAGQLKNPYSWGAIKWHLLINNCLANPTFMARRDFFKNAGEFESNLAEDYGLWLRAAEKGLRLANLPEVLLRYRVHAGSISLTKKNAMLNVSAEVLRRYSRILAGYDLDQGLAEDCLRLADTRIPISSVLRIVPFYGALAWGSVRDPESSFCDTLFILRRSVSRVGKGFLRSLARGGAPA